MDEQELIRVDLRLPASALDSLSRLAEQLRKLTAVISRLEQPAGEMEEMAESGSFNPEQFMALQQKSETAANRRPQKDIAEAPSVQSVVSEQVRNVKSAGAEAVDSPEEAEQAEPVPDDRVRDLEPPSREEEPGANETQEEILTARPVMEEQLPDAPSVRMEADTQISEAKTIWGQTEDQELPVSAVQTDISMGAETPLGAGLVVTAQPEGPVSRWSGVTEELVTTGPAPLTAEAVSLAFQRDGRRYDNGFPLY